METTKYPPLDPLGEVPISPAVAALPKADLHLHQQWSPRLDRVLARRHRTPSYEEHPIHEFVERGIPVALCADMPVQIATTIGREYALAHARGFSLAELVGFTTNAIHAFFTTPARKAVLLADLADRAGGGDGRSGS